MIPYKMIYTINMHTTVYQFWRFVYHHEQSVIMHKYHYIHILFCAKIRLHVYHLSWPHVEILFQAFWPESYFLYSVICCGGPSPSRGRWPWSQSCHRCRQQFAESPRCWWEKLVEEQLGIDSHCINVSLSLLCILDMLICIYIQTRLWSWIFFLDSESHL